LLASTTPRCSTTHGSKSTDALPARHRYSRIIWFSVGVTRMPRRTRGPAITQRG
jgi:hypothetical protein